MDARESPYGQTTPLVEFHRVASFEVVSSIEVKYNRLMKRVAANLKRLRKARELSQADMEKFGFDLRNYQRLESGAHSPSLFTLHKLSVALKIEMAEFFK